jgi:predicted phosphodiesterase
MKREQIAFLGGIYSNFWALQAALEECGRRDVSAIYFLGDAGAFGPYPDRVFPLLREAGVQCLQGNYDNSIGHGLADCQCGYTDPRDNAFARISYAYTLAKTSRPWRAWMREWPREIRLNWHGYRLLLCHGSPRQTNEFLWESTCSEAFLEDLCNSYQADVILATHTGLKWHRRLRSGRHFINVGVLGRPENDGRTNVWMTILSASEADLAVEFVPVEYDYERLAAEMRAEKLPDEFVETIRTGWWTTCLEVLPARERRRGRF